MLSITNKFIFEVILIILVRMQKRIHPTMDYPIVLISILLFIFVLVEYLILIFCFPFFVR